MSELITILLLLALVLLIVGVLILSIIIILKSKEESKLFKDSLIDLHETNSKISSEINIRLISIVTEALLGSGPLYNRDVQEFDNNIKSHDNEIIAGILNPEESEPFDPFAVSDETLSHPLDNQDSSETILDQSAVYNTNQEE